MINNSQNSRGCLYNIRIDASKGLVICYRWSGQMKLGRGGGVMKKQALGVGVWEWVMK